MVYAVCIKGQPHTAAVKIQEDAAMRHKPTRYPYSSRRCPAYPNMADANYFKKKILNTVCTLATGAALTLCLVLLATML